MDDRSDNDETQARSAGSNAAARPMPEGTAVSLPVPPDAPVVEASTLFGGHRQVVIGHNGCRYVLRITRHGKLILNK
jgi:hemin uptake protein HemP